MLSFFSSEIYVILSRKLNCLARTVPISEKNKNQKPKQNKKGDPDAGI